MRVTVGSGGLTRPDGTPVPPIPVGTGPGGRLKAADIPLVRGRCYPLDLTVRGPGSGYHVSVVPIDRPGPQAQSCYGCCCMQLHEEPSDPPPAGGTLLGNHCGGTLPEDKRVELCLPLVDIDVDSDNDSGLTRVRSSGGEDAGEDDTGASGAPKPGKLALVNDGDIDGDAIPDYADGYDRDGVADTDDDGCAGGAFVPLAVELAGLGEPVDPSEPSQVRVVFTYSGSDPAAVTVTPDPAGVALPTYALPVSGSLRLWRKDAGQARSAAADYVVPGQEYTLEQLGLGPAGGELTLWAEAVRHSATAGDARVSVGVVGQCGEDAVRLTAFGTRIVEVHSDGSTEPVAKPQLSEPTPVITLAGWSVSNVRTTPDSAQILADLSFTGSVDDAASDLIAGVDGVISTLHIRVNGEPVYLHGQVVPASIPISVTKATTPDGVLRPYNYSGQFSATMTGVPVGIGFNQLELVAANVYGFRGFVQGAFEITATPPATGFGAIDLEFDFGNASSPYSTDPNDRVTSSFVIGGQAVLKEFAPSTSVPAEPGWWVSTDGTTDFRVQPGAAYTAGTADTWALEISSPDLRLLRGLVTHIETGNDTRVFTARRFFADEERPDWSGYAFQVGDVTPTENLRASTGGAFKPFLFEFVAPPEVRAMVVDVTIGTERYYPVEHNGKTFLATEAHVAAELPRPFLALPANLLSPSPAPEPEPQPEGSYGFLSFAEGFGSGLVDTGVGIWDGVKQVASGAWHVVRHYNTVSVLYRLATEGRFFTVEDEKTIRVTAEFVKTVADVVYRILQDEAALVEAVLTGNNEELNRLGEKYKVVIGFSVEILQAVKDELTSMDDYDKGRLTGRIVGEVAVTVGGTVLTAGGAAVAKGATMVGVATKVRNLSYIRNLQNGQRIIDKIDDIIDLMRACDAATICFPAGTLVHTASGLVPIEQVAAGDLVLARDEGSGCQEERRVLSVRTTHAHELYEVRYQPDGAPGHESIRATAGHPFFVVNRDAFVPADELLPGDTFALASGGTATVIDIEVERGPPVSGTATFNLEVDEYHTYFVGEHGVWVHNAGAPCDEFWAIIRRFVDADPNRDWLGAFQNALASAENALPGQASGPISGDVFRKFALGLMREIYSDPSARKPSYAELDVAWRGRKLAAELEVNHCVPRVWIEALFERASLGEPSTATINSVPGLAMWRRRHNLGAGLPGEPSFHTILESKIGREASDDQAIADIIAGLEQTYSEMNRLYGQQDGTDYNAVWQNARQWLIAKGVP